LIDVITGLLGGLAGMLSSIGFLVLLLFFTVTDAAAFAASLAGVSPAGRRLAEAFELFARGSRRYLAVATIFGAVVALLDVIALTILDIRYAWLWGLLAFITNYIPNVGFIIGLLPPTIIALLDHDAKTALLVVVIYCVLNVILQSVIQPRVVGNTVGLSGTLSFLSLLVWATILGGVGALLAVPASLFVKALFIDVEPDRQWVNPLLGSPPRTVPPEPAEDVTVPPEPAEDVTSDSTA
jgi:predicted PurR-regulated permease PerM